MQSPQGNYLYREEEGSSWEAATQLPARLHSRAALSSSSPPHPTPRHHVSQVPCPTPLQACAPALGSPGKGRGSHSTSPPGSHSLLYYITTTSGPGVREPRVIIVGYVDDTEFMSFDSDTESSRTEPRGSWVKRMGQKFWEEEINLAKNFVLWGREDLQLAMSIYNHSDDGE